MPRHDLDINKLTKNEDWVGNNAAFTCPQCGKVFLVSGFIHRKGRPCPKCGSAHGKVEGGAETERGAAYIEW